MPTARELISEKVAKGRETDRLADVALEIQTHDVHYCVVLDESGRRFVGLIRLGEVAVRAHAPNRILADLISPVKPLIVRPTEPVQQVARLFTQYHINEAIVLDPQGHYLGLINSRTVLEWSERERQRAEEALRHTNLRLEAAALAQKNLIEGLSHELRTPLVPALLLASNGASDPSVPAALRRNFEEIAEFVSHEAKLIDALLDQQSIQRGALAIEKVRVSIDAILRSVVAEAGAAIAEKSIAFDYKPAPTALATLGDADRLHQAFAHLVDNAVKFTPTGGKVSLAVTGCTDSSSIAVTLADTGIGFAADERERAFTPFSRRSGRNPHQAQPQAGLGLGLSLARAIIELHGGTIEMSSGGRGLGTTLIVTLPSEPASDSAPPGAS